MDHLLSKEKKRIKKNEMFLFSFEWSTLKDDL